MAGPCGKAVPTPPAAFTPMQHKVTSVSQRRRDDTRAGTEVQQQQQPQQQQQQQQQAGRAANTMVAPHSGSVESKPGRGNKWCSSPCLPCPLCPPRRASSGGGTSGSSTMQRDAVRHLSSCGGCSCRNPQDAAPTRQRRGTEQWHSVSCRNGNREWRAADPSRKGAAAARQQAPGTSSSRSRVREYRKRVCVRWGSLQWSLALVVVVRSAGGLWSLPTLPPSLWSPVATPGVITSVIVVLVPW